MKDFFYTIILFFSVFVITFWVDLDSTESTNIERGKITTKTPKCLQMFYAIEKYATLYDVPKSYAYGVAYYETRYQGPFHWKYDHYKTSTAGALGPMQIMYSTGKSVFPDREFTKEELKDNIELNVECSMKLIHDLYEKYQDWPTVFGVYNTGKVLVNDYARNVVSYKLTGIK